MGRNIDAHNHHLHGEIPAEIAENLKDFFPDYDDLSYEEVLQQQESVYQFFQENVKNRGMTTDNGHSNWSHLSGQEGESSRGGSVLSQEALDEALARSLQELGEDFDKFFIHENSGTADGSTESPVVAPARAMNQVLTQDDINPDNMSFEELLTLGETVGVESKGLSEDLISRLPNFKYKTGMFSKKKKKKKEDCVICQMAYDSGDRLTILPCAHQYHLKCIAKWLKLSKNCPVCQMEVLQD